MREILRLTIVIALCAAGPSLAAPTGLLVIPTADIQEVGTYQIEWENDGHSGFPAGVNQGFLNTQFGLFPRVEAGVDFVVSGEPRTALFNYKYAFPLGRTHMAVGTYNIGHESRPISYLISGTKTGIAQLHLGAQVSEGKVELLAGAHREFGRLMLEADYTSGRENLGSAGFEYALSRQWTLQWGALFSNNGQDTEFTMHIIYTNRFAKAREEAAKPPPHGE